MKTDEKVEETEKKKLVYDVTTKTTTYTYNTHRVRAENAHAAALVVIYSATPAAGLQADRFRVCKVKSVKTKEPLFMENEEADGTETGGN